MSFLTGTNAELLYASTAPGTAKNTFTAEALINDTTGMGVQAKLPANFWLPNQAQKGRGIAIVARGILSVVAATTPTYTFTVRLGASGVTGPIVLGTAALTTASGTTGTYWELVGDVIMENIGAAGNNSTVRGIGRHSGGGISTNGGVNAAYGGAASPGTVATVDWNIDNYINVGVACSASAAGNTITLQQLLVYGLN